VLDIGCGYGSHLERAYRRGWKCFGVEVSEHARKVIAERHGRKLFVVGDVENLLPHEFDVILLLDVLEHLTDPYHVFYTLFAKGAITPKTLVVIATPNGRSAAAMANPERWPYRHPPSHLVYFSAHSLSVLLKRLRFSSIAISGLHPEAAEVESAASDGVQENAGYVSFGGLLCKASGSDFSAFMQERYVPGTWSKLAEYEHLPRYLFARKLVADRRVLDFGCGSGYGTALLAHNARSVLGIDIDAGALDWAREHHRALNLSFEERNDLGESLSSASFDLITCFEVIEHVSEATQIALVRNFARLVTKAGLVLLSTPNPDITKLYGANPYHVREMERAEFEELLRAHFRFVSIFEQWIQPSVLIGPQDALDGTATLQGLALTGTNDTSAQAAIFIAICSHEPAGEQQASCFLDVRSDYIAEHLRAQALLNRTRFEAYEASEDAVGARSALAAREERVAEQQQALERQRAALTEQANKLAEQARLTGALRNELAEQSRMLNEFRNRAHYASTELEGIRSSPWYRLGVTLKTERLSAAKLASVARLVGDLAGLRRSRHVADRVIEQARPDSQAPPVAAPDAIAPYRVRKPVPNRHDRPRVVHAIANFMTGGSSRLVVDLIERLGGSYDQRVLTSHIPNPPAYLDLDIEKIDRTADVTSFTAYLAAQQPELVHVHYWGDCDAAWYSRVFSAVELLGYPVVENVNTPVKPYVSACVLQYVYVSMYLRDTFGHNESKSVVIYPGSNFELFSRAHVQDLADDCIGMVYRLERDKLNAESIDPIVHAVERRPGTRALIVGGGSLLDGFRRKVEDAGLQSRFTFTGYVPYEQLPALYAQFSVFVAPVWQESFGQVSPFAMSMGIPVAGYRVGALPEIVENPGLLASAGDSRELAEVLVRLLDDRGERLAVGERNRQRARERFSLEAMIQSYRALYSELIQERH
jgi:glycosyltransferase involved in cell wall biosynthesis/2-polyprenyl-3-methyl-5-hydroxy-6-metoxy-1,4-benzoquinol methylase